MNTLKLDRKKMDMLKELFNMGAGNSANSVSKMTGERVMISVPALHICRVYEVRNLLGEMERQMIGIYHTVNGGIKGRVLLLLSENSGKMLSVMVRQKSNFSSTEADEMGNILKEFSNIIVGSYLNALSSVLGLRIIHSVPDLASDMVGALLDDILAQIAEKEDFVILLKTVLQGKAGIFEIYLLFLPEFDALNNVLEALSQRY